MLDFAKARRMMVDGQLRTFDVNDFSVLAAFDEVPRERFVPTGREFLAYTDQDLPVSADDAAERRFMLSPMVLGRMIQALDVGPAAKVLDVACGLGYSTAVLARIGCSVIALEANEGLAEEARRRLTRYGAGGVTVVAGPLERGCPDAAPYEAILVNGSVEVRPDGLLGQLADGGRLVCIQGRGRSAQATRYVRARDGFGAGPLFDAAAPPLRPFRAEPGFVF